MIVFGLGKNVLFKSVLGHCVEGVKGQNCLEICRLIEVRNFKHERGDVKILEKVSTSFMDGP